MDLKLGIETYQIFTYNDEVCIPSYSSILLAVQDHMVRICVIYQMHFYQKEIGMNKD